MTQFYNGINEGGEGQGQRAGDAYCWIVGVLYGAWEFYGYDASVHLAEETKDASSVVARGIWLGKSRMVLHQPSAITSSPQESERPSNCTNRHPSNMVGFCPNPPAGPFLPALLLCRNDLALRKRLHNLPFRPPRPPRRPNSPHDTLH